MILYTEYDCFGRSVKIEAPGKSNLTNLWESTVTGERTLSLLYSQYPKWKWETTSYHVCNNKVGGSTLDLEILSNDPNIFDQYDDGAITLEIYHDLCTCRNVPEYVQQLDKWFINNHGNSLMACFSPDCSSTEFFPLWVPARVSSYSFGLGLFKLTDPVTGIHHKIQSFGPDPNSKYFLKSCNKNCTAHPLVRNINTTRINIGRICDFDTKTECMQVVLLHLEQMQARGAKVQELIEEIQTISNKLTTNGE